MRMHPTRLEFALTIVAIGTVAALALGRIAGMQVSARDAGLEAGAAHARALAALNEARCARTGVAPAAAPREVSPDPASATGTTRRADPPSPPCP